MKSPWFIIVLYLLLFSYHGLFQDLKKKKKGVEDDLVWTNQKGKVRTTKLAVCLASPVPKYPYPHYLLKREENQNQAEKQRHYKNVSVGL